MSEKKYEVQAGFSINTIRGVVHCSGTVQLSDFSDPEQAKKYLADLLSSEKIKEVHGTGVRKEVEIPEPEKPEMPTENKKTFGANRK